MSEETPIVDVQPSEEATNPPEDVQEVPAENATTPEPVKEEDGWKDKFTNSFKETMKYKQQLEEREAEIERLRQLAEQGATYSNDSESLYPGFDELDEYQKKELIAYTNSIKNKVKEEVYSDPAIAFAKQSYNETKWNGAFEKVSSKFPELSNQKEDFKKKYFNKDIVPENIDTLLEDIAKIYLFDSAKELGAKEAQEQASRIDIERASGGATAPSATRTLEDWQKLAATNPAEFAKNAKQFNEDLDSGKLK